MNTKNIWPRRKTGFANSPALALLLLLFNLAGISWVARLYLQQGGTTQGSSSSSMITGGYNVNAATVYLTDPQYAFPGIAQFVCDAGFTSSSNVITTPVTDRPFNGTGATRIAQVGDIVWGANAQCGGEGSVFVPVSVVPQTTILSVDGPHQIHTVANATTGCTVVAKDNCVLVWGPDATTALQNAWTQTGNNCGALIMPAGGIITLLPPANTTALCNGPAGGNDIGSSLTVSGAGPYTTMLLTPPIPVSWANTMFSDPIGGQRRSFHDFGVASFAAAPAVLNSQAGFSMGFYGEFYNVSFLNWYPCNNIACSNTFTPLTATGVGNAPINIHDNICLNSGSGSGCMSVGNGVTVTHNAIQNVIRGITVTSAGGSANYLSENSFVLNGTGGSAGNAAFGNGGGGTTYSTNDTYGNGSGTSLPCMQFTSPQTVYFKNATIQCGTTTTGPTMSIPSGVVVAIEGEHSSVVYSNGNGGTGNNLVNAGTLTLRNTALAVSGGGSVLSNSGTVLFKEGNTFSGGNITNTGTFNVINGEGGYVGSCTGTITTATTVGLYGLGQNTTTTCTQVVVASGQVMSKSGSVYALQCTAGTAGSTASAACTVVKNGAAQTMTCSLNGVTSCTDGTAAHVVSFVPGDIIGVEAIGGVADTLANIKGLIVAE